MSVLLECGICQRFLGNMNIQFCATFQLQTKGSHQLGRTLTFFFFFLNLKNDSIGHLKIFVFKALKGPKELEIGGFSCFSTF